MPELVGALLSNHAYLFDDVQRAAIDERHRAIREAAAVVTKGGDADRISKAEATLTDSRERLLQILETLPQYLEVARNALDAASAAKIPVPVPGEVGAVLLRFRGGGGMRGARIAYDMSASRDPIMLEITPGVDTLALLSLSGVPPGRQSVVVEVTRPGRGRFSIPVTIESPEAARLRVAVRSSGTDDAVPAMISLRWLTDGSDRRPSNAVELAEQFENLGRASSLRHATLPGRLNGRLWWCVPGPFDMLVPPGRWEIVVRRGLEHVPVFDTFDAQPGDAIVKDYAPRRWVNMAEHGWYSGDEHVHARLASDEDARRLLTWAAAEDVHVASILQMGDMQRTWFAQRGFGPDARVRAVPHPALRDGMGHPARERAGDQVLVPGQECPRTHSSGFGHSISLNTKSLVRDVDRYWLYDGVADTVHEQGGLFGFAHIWNPHIAYQRGLSLFVPTGKVDFGEILQIGALGTELYYEFLNLGFRLTATAGSDVPWQGTIGEVRTYAYVGEGGLDPDAWFEAVREGHTFVTNGPMLELRVDDAMPGGTVKVDEPRGVHVSARAWGDAERSLPESLEIIVHGAVARRAAAESERQEEIPIEFDLDGAFGFWIAARAHGRDGSIAHTTPVYVVREGFRFWKFDDVDALLAKRLDNLANVAELVAGARRRVDSGEASRMVWHEVESTRQMAKQGDALLERVDAARQIYEGLKKTAAKEKGLRTPSR